MSALDSEIDKVKAFKFGAADYITKPFFLDEAFLRIEAQLKICRQQKKFYQLVQEHIQERKNIEQNIKDSFFWASCVTRILKGISRGPEALQRHLNDFPHSNVLCWP